MRSSRQRFYGFMYGRYGVDNLCRAMCVLMCVIAVLNIFIRSYLLYTLNTVLLIFLVFRMFSKNIAKRTEENQKYLKLRGKITAEIKLVKMRFRDRNVCRYRKCPVCGAVMKLPIKKGSHTVVCRNCTHEFRVKI